MSLGICHTATTGNNNDDFEGLHFTELDGDYTVLSPNCKDSAITNFDLSARRLIGFRVINSDYRGGRVNIRSIAPIVDYFPACDPL